MDAVRPLLAPNEHVLVRTRAHGAMLAGALLRAGAALAGLAVVVWIVGRDGIAGEGEWLALAAAGVVAAAALARLLRRLWEWGRTELAVTEAQLVVVRGTLYRTLETVPLAAVDELKVRQTRPGRLLGYGTIQLSCGRRRNGLAFVPRPERIRALIASQVESRRADAVHTTASVVHRRVAA